jgi:hypothetical protein
MHLNDEETEGDNQSSIDRRSEASQRKDLGIGP